MSAPTVGADRFTDDFLQSLRRVGDPPADEVVATYLDSLDDTSGHLIASLIAHGSRSTDETDAPLRSFVEERPARPAWADPKLVTRGQEVFAENVAAFGLGLWMASIPAGYAGADGAAVLTHTTRLVSDAKRRFLETGQFIIDVMTPGGLDATGNGLSDIRHVRLMHASARHLLMHGDIAGAEPFDHEKLGVPLNQEDLLGTLFTFSLVGLQVLQRSGVRLSDEDREAYVHTWNVVGHGMGIRDDMLPLDFADSTEVFERIKTRAYGPSEAGAELTAAAIAVMQDLLQLRILRGIPAAGIREYLGHDVAELLGVPKAGWSRAFFLPDRWVNQIVAKLNHDSRLARRFGEAMGRRLFKGFLAYERAGQHRPAFELNEALAEQLHLD